MDMNLAEPLTRDYQLCEDTDRLKGYSVFPNVYYLKSVTGKYIKWKGQSKTLCLVGFAF